MTIFDKTKFRVEHQKFFKKTILETMKSRIKNLKFLQIMITSQYIDLKLDGPNFFR